MAERNEIKSNFSKGVFAGPGAIRDFHNPENHPYLPLVELPESVNPLKSDGVRMFAKLLTALPGGHVKFGTAYSMLHHAEQAGELEGVHKVIEASSGNTGAAEAQLAPHFGGAPEVTVYVAPNIPDEKKRLLQLYGVHVIEAENGIDQVRKERDKDGIFNPAQHENLHNPEFFHQVIGPQIWEQTDGKITVFCAGLGSTGTMIGTSSYLKHENPGVLAIGIFVPEGESVPGARRMTRLNDVSLPWRDAADRIRSVSAHDSYATSLQLIRKASLSAGPSTGFALRGLVDELTQMKEEGTLDTIRNQADEVVAVFPVPDGPTPYVDEYFQHLDPSFFKPIIPLNED